MPTTNIEDECVDKNPGNSCHQRACMVESILLTVILENVGNQIECDSANKHDNGFDAQNQCKTPSGGGSGGSGSGSGGNPECRPPPNPLGPPNVETKACCGSYATGRFPFVTCSEDIITGDSGKQCCEDKVYNAELFSCCDGNVQVGSC